MKKRASSTQAKQLRKKNISAFSLVELLVVLSIVSMLLTLAGHSYVRYIQKSKLLQAQSDLLIFASRMEQYKLFNLDYLGAAGTQISPLNTGKPWVFQSYSPANKTEQQRLFNLSILYVSENGQDYQIVASPVGTEAANSYGSLIFYSDGTRGYDKNQDGEFSNDEMCWQC